MKRIRILLADDNLQMLARINSLLRTDFEVVASVADGYSLVEAAFKVYPDVIVTDISMPKMNGIEAVRTIRRSLPDTTFIFFTMHSGLGYRREAQRVGAAGYVLKSATPEELTRTIRHAVKERLSGETSNHE